MWQASRSMGRASLPRELVDNPRGAEVRRKAVEAAARKLSADCTFSPLLAASKGPKAKARPSLKDPDARAAADRQRAQELEVITRLRFFYLFFFLSRF